MKSNSLHQQCIRLYQEMVQETAGCECIPSGEANWIEWGIGLSSLNDFCSWLCPN